MKHSLILCSGLRAFGTGGFGAGGSPWRSPGDVLGGPLGKPGGSWGVPGGGLEELWGSLGDIQGETLEEILQGGSGGGLGGDLGELWGSHSLEVGMH